MGKKGAKQTPAAAATTRAIEDDIISHAAGTGGVGSGGSGPVVLRLGRTTNYAEWRERMSEHLISQFGKHAQFTRDDLQYYYPEPDPPQINWARLAATHGSRRMRSDQLTMHKQLWRAACEDVSTAMLAFPSPSLLHTFRGFSLPDSASSDWAQWDETWGWGGCHREDDDEDEDEDDEEEEEGYVLGEGRPVYPPGSVPYSALLEDGSRDPTFSSSFSTATGTTAVTGTGAGTGTGGKKTAGASGKKRSGSRKQLESAASSQLSLNKPTFVSIEDGVAHYINDMLHYNLSINKECQAHLQMTLIMHSWLDGNALALLEAHQRNHAIVVANHNAYVLWRLLQYMCARWDAEGAKPLHSLELRRRRAFSSAALTEAARFSAVFGSSFSLLRLLPDCNFDEWRLAAAPILEKEFGEDAAFVRTGVRGKRPASSDASSSSSSSASAKVAKKGWMAFHILGYSSLLTTRVLFQERSFFEAYTSDDAFALWTLVSIICRRVAADLEQEKKSGQRAPEGCMLQYVRHVAWEEGIDVPGAAARPEAAPTVSPLGAPSTGAFKEHELGRALANRAQMYATTDCYGQPVDQSMDLLYVMPTSTNYTIGWRDEMVALLKRRFGSHADFISTGQRPVFAKKEAAGTCMRKMTATITYRMHPIAINFLSVNRYFSDALERQDAFDLWRALEMQLDLMCKRLPGHLQNPIASHAAAMGSVVMPGPELGSVRHEPMPMLVFRPFFACNYMSAWRPRMTSLLLSEFPKYSSFLQTGKRYVPETARDICNFEQVEKYMIAAMVDSLTLEAAHLVMANNLYDVMCRKEDAFGVWRMIEHVYESLKRFNEVEFNPKQVFASSDLMTVHDLLGSLLRPQSEPATPFGAAALAMLQKYGDASALPDGALLVQGRPDPSSSSPEPADIAELEELLRDDTSSRKAKKGGDAGTSGGGGGSSKSKKAKKKSKAKRIMGTAAAAADKRGGGDGSVSSSDDSSSSESEDEDEEDQERTGGNAAKASITKEAAQLKSTSPDKKAAPVTNGSGEKKKTGSVQDSSSSSSSSSTSSRNAASSAPSGAASVSLLLRLGALEGSNGTSSSSNTSSNNNYSEWRQQMESRLRRDFGPSVAFLDTNQRSIDDSSKDSDNNYIALRIYDTIASSLHPSVAEDIRSGPGGGAYRTIASRRDAFALWRLLELEHFNCVFRGAAAGAGDDPREVAAQCAEHYRAFEEEVLVETAVSGDHYRAKHEVSVSVPLQKAPEVVEARQPVATAAPEVVIAEEEDEEEDNLPDLVTFDTMPALVQLNGRSVAAAPVEPTTTVVPVAVAAPAPSRRPMAPPPGLGGADALWDQRDHHTAPHQQQYHLPHHHMQQQHAASWGASTSAMMSSPPPLLPVAAAAAAPPPGLEVEREGSGLGLGGWSAPPQHQMRPAAAAYPSNTAPALAPVLAAAPVLAPVLATAPALAPALGAHHAASNGNGHQLYPPPRQPQPIDLVPVSQAWIGGSSSSNSSIGSNSGGGMVTLGGALEEDEPPYGYSYSYAYSPPSSASTSNASYSLEHSLSQLMMDDDSPTTSTSAFTTTSAAAASAPAYPWDLPPSRGGINGYGNSIGGINGSSNSNHDSSSIGDGSLAPSPLIAEGWLPKSATAPSSALASYGSSVWASTSTSTTAAAAAATMAPVPADCFLCADLGVTGPDARHDPQRCPRRQLLRQMASLNAASSFSSSS